MGDARIPHARANTPCTGGAGDMIDARVKHPAQFTPALLPVMASQLAGARRILDPFAGLGNVFKLAAWLPGAEIYGVEIEPEWAACDPRVTQGNALHLPYPAGYFDAVCTSPTYGNRLADHHRARDATRRRSYTHDLGRPLHPDNAGRLQWGEAYRDFHRRAWAEVRRVLDPRARFVLNCKDHVRGGDLVPVPAWHIETLQALGFDVVKWERVPCPGMRWGANHAARADVESVILFQLV